MFTDNLNETFKKNITVSLSEDKMAALILLASPPLSESYSVDEILQALKAKNILYGIDTDKIEEIVTKRMHNVPVIVAKGTPMKLGTVGSYEYLFNVAPDRKPKTLSDGSVDYRSLNLLEPVKEGDILAIYHPAVPGVPGRTVMDTPAIPPPVKDLPTLKGTGFTLSEDKEKYTANFSGKVELINGQLYVTNVLLINGDTDASTGDIQFSGDVIITGNVHYGYSIFAEGSIIINGNVEAASLTAGMNVELRSGMQGGGKGTIDCKGNVSGKFFEQVTINCRGDLNANSILHCNIRTDGQVIVSGRHGIIVGGTVEALGGISATVLGNISETKTNLIVGASASVAAEISTLESEIFDTSELIDKITLAVEKINKLLEKYPNDQMNAKKSELIRQKITLTASIAEKTTQRELLQNKLETAEGAFIRTSKYLYPEVRMMINGVRYRTQNTFHNVTVKCVGIEVKIFSNA